MSEAAQHITTTDEFVERINGMTVEGITPEQIRAVLEAANLAKAGDKAGTVKLCPEGKVAVRVTDHGVDQWVVVSPDGGVWRDMQPTLPAWSCLRSAETS